MTERQLAQLIWQEDGPVYRGWPNIGERVHIGYWDQYPGDKERCFRLARAIINKFGAVGETPPPAKED